MICKKVYASREYRRGVDNCLRIPTAIEVNSPEVLPTLSQDNSKIDITLPSNYFKNNNYPSGEAVISSHNSFTVRFLRGSRIPSYIPKRMPFLLISHTDKIEDAYLIMI